MNVEVALIQIIVASVIMIHPMTAHRIVWEHQMELQSKMCVVNVVE
jgi:hypothetical protein